MFSLSNSIGSNVSSTNFAETTTFEEGITNHWLTSCTLFPNASVTSIESSLYPGFGIILRFTISPSSAEYLSAETIPFALESMLIEYVFTSGTGGSKGSIGNSG